MRFLAEEGTFIVRAWSQHIERSGRASLPVHLIEFDSSQFTPDLYARYVIECPPALTKSVAKRKAEFLCGRVAARTALRDLNLSATHVPTGAAGEPIWPSGVMGSITHSGSFAGAVAQQIDVNGGIGIDLENVFTDLQAHDVDELVFGRSELSIMLQMTHRLPLNVLKTILFSAKESFYKSVFPLVRRFIEFDELNLLDIDVDAKKLTCRIANALSEQLKRVEMIEIYYDFIEADLLLTICEFSSRSNQVHAQN